jgi:hypothetical protein
VYTDDAGHFLYRLRTRGDVKLAMAWEEFLTPGVFEVVHAPDHVAAEGEAGAHDEEIVIRRRRTAAIELRQTTPEPQAGASSQNNQPNR